MHCPSCHAEDTKVIDSRMSAESNVIRRRRKCDACDFRFSTHEKIIFQMPLVIKRDGRREIYNREKILKGLNKACQKRPISVDQINQLLENIEMGIMETSQVEIESTVVGSLIMEKLRDLDPVSYVRFASFYWNYKDVEDFVYGLKNNLCSNKEIINEQFN